MTHVLFHITDYYVTKKQSGERRIVKSLSEAERLSGFDIRIIFAMSMAYHQDLRADSEIKYHHRPFYILYFSLNPFDSPMLKTQLPKGAISWSLFEAASIQWADVRARYIWASFTLEISLKLLSAGSDYCIRHRVGLCGHSFDIDAGRRSPEGTLPSRPFLVVSPCCENGSHTEDDPP